jgi:hypothetical protein
VWVLWDQPNPRIGYECEDVDLAAQFTERVEAFLDPRPSQTDVYFGLEMNARAVLYDCVPIKSAQHVLKLFSLQGGQWDTFIDGTPKRGRRSEQGLEPGSSDPVGQLREACAPHRAGHVWTGSQPQPPPSRTVRPPCVREVLEDGNRCVA